MLSKEKQMDVLEAYDLTKSLRGAAQLTGVDHHTVARYVAGRVAGRSIEEMPQERSKASDDFADKIAEWIDRSNGKVRADVVHERLIAMGYTGSERTTRRVVAILKSSYRRATHRVYKPWIPEPGLWLQYDFGDGPVVDGTKTVLFCAWLAWSRFRVIIPLVDRTMPSVVAALDQTFRLIGGASTYVLTDNEKTVTDRHIAGIAVRNEAMVAVSNYYGVTICTCVPYDPESKGGSESTVKIAKADLVPTDANLLDEYHTFAELEGACAAAMATFNGRKHSVTRRVPAVALQEELAFLHRLPDAPYTAAFGESRRVGWSSVISYRGARYSVPHDHCDTRVWVRTIGDEVIIVADEGSSAKKWHVTRLSPLAGPPSATSTIRNAPANHVSGALGRPVDPKSSSWHSAKGPSATWSKERRVEPGALKPAWPRRLLWPPSMGQAPSTRLSGSLPWPGAFGRAISSRSLCTPPVRWWCAAARLTSTPWPRAPRRGATTRPRALRPDRERALGGPDRRGDHLVSAPPTQIRARAGRGGGVDCSGSALGSD